MSRRWCVPLFTLSVVLLLPEANSASAAAKLPAAIKPCVKSMNSDACGWSLLGYTFGAKAPLSETDNDALLGVLGQTGKWNTALTPLIRGLLDEAVSGDAWLASYKRVIPKLRGFVSTMRTSSLGIRDKDVRKFIAPITATYERQIVELERLAASIRDGDPALQNVSRTALSKLAISKGELMKAGIDRLIDLGIGKDFNEVLAAKAKRLAEQMGG